MQGTLLSSIPTITSTLHLRELYGLYSKFLASGDVSGSGTGTGGHTYFHWYISYTISITLLRKLYASTHECPCSYDKLRFDPSKLDCRLMATFDDYSMMSKLPKERHQWLQY
ncbi:hypothetical protein MKW92_025826 [Papaver armeniacum]|nr:hypothetical protein MKW92_025826 [Papaver armeniacum]